MKFLTHVGMAALLIAGIVCCVKAAEALTRGMYGDAALFAAGFVAIALVNWIHIKVAQRELKEFFDNE